MAKRFSAVEGSQDFERLIERSQDEPILIFKHSTTCPISAAAYREMSRVAAEVSLVVVQDARKLSDEIAKRTGVRHESPQALVLRRGEAVWTASHFSIKADEVERALSENA
ncbi:MAG TPA: bacillithiol system redox-active protein YtxJ [Pyrinomonadaceae bacterium]|nr:bacillithiol system redox-active protein YtxJ [Pyrinomonadaceae bacterium]